MMCRKNLLIVVICVVFGMILSSTSFAASDKVGYINLQRLINESKMGQAARADIQKMRQAKEAVLRTKLDEINKLRAYINKNAAKMVSTEKRDKIEKLKKIYKDYQRLLADSKEDIVREDRELVAIILKKADSVLKKVAKKKKFGIILKDPNSIGYLNPDVDITDAVLKELNKKR